MVLGDLLKIQTTDDVCTVEKVVGATKELISFDGPYTWIFDANDRDVKIPIFSDSFIQVTRMVLSNLSEPSGCIAQMSPLERELWYDFSAFQTARSANPLDDAGFLGDRLVVLERLNACILNELECRTETYLDRCFNISHSWDTCTLTST